MICNVVSTDCPYIGDESERRQVEASKGKDLKGIWVKSFVANEFLEENLFPWSNSLN